MKIFPVVHLSDVVTGMEQAEIALVGKRPEFAGASILGGEPGGDGAEPRRLRPLDRPGTTPRCDDRRSPRRSRLAGKRTRSDTRLLTRSLHVWSR